MSVSKRINKITVSPTMKVAQLALEMKSKGEDIIDLSVGEPDFPTPQNVKDAAVKAINNDFTKYTLNPGTIELRTAIVNKLKNENGLDYSTNEIIVSNGAKHSIYNTIQTLVEDGDEVIILAPYYVSYPEMVSLADGVSKIIPTTEEMNFKITVEQLKNAISPKTKLLIFCSPSNPTGSAYSEKEFCELAEIIERENFYILSDEIYEKVIYDDFKFVSFASLSERIKNRTITVNGHSKSYSMTGWRIGYAAGSEHIIKAMNKVQSHSTSNASSISQAAALEALIGQQESVENSRKEFERRRNFFYERINSIKGISCFKPQGAFYLFPNVSSFFGKSANSKKINSSIDLSEYLLNEVKVAVVPGSAFGAEGYFRMSFSASIGILKTAADRIESALEKLS